MQPRRQRGRQETTTHPQPEARVGRVAQVVMVNPPDRRVAMAAMAGAAVMHQRQR
jgi:hypothetical protein